MKYITMQSFLFLFITIASIYILFFNNGSIYSVIKLCIKIVIIFLLFFSLWYTYTKIAVKDTQVNSKNTCNKVVELFKHDEYKLIYELFNNKLRKKYTDNKFYNLIEEINRENNCINFICTNVTSADNFTLRLLNCENDEDVLKIIFSGGWGLGWKISNIQTISN